MGCEDVMPEDSARSPADERPVTDELCCRIVDAFDCPVHVVDRNLRILFINRAFRRWCNELGFTNNIAGQHLSEAFPFLPSHVHEEYERVFQTGRDLRTEERTTFGDREVLTETEKFPLFAGEGVSHVVTVLRDITRRKVAEAELSATLRKLQGMESIVNRSPAMVFRWRLAEGWPVEYCSENVSQLGYTAEDFLSGRVSYAEIIPREDRARIGVEVEGHVRAARKEYFQQYRLRDRAGRLRWVSDWTRTLRDERGEITHCEGIVLDVTQGRRAEAALFESEARLRAILSSLHQTAIAVYERDGRLTSLWGTKEADDRYGLSQTEVQGKKLEELFSAEEAATLLSPIQEVFHTGRSTRTEYTLQMPNGAFRFETVLSPMRGPDAEIVAAVAFIRDETDRWRTRQALRRAHGKLVEAREAARRHLAGELHDSVGQELMALRLRLQSVRDDAERAGQPDLVEALARIAAQCGGLMQQVRQISHGLYPPTLEKLGLVPSLRKLLTACEPTGVEGTLEHREDLERLRFDPGVEIALFRIAQEAIRNALRHAEPDRIEVSLHRQDGRLCLAVTDDGCGFDPAAALGRGMGLVSMRDRADAVGGTLHIASQPGRTRVEAAAPLDPPVVCC